MKKIACFLIIIIVTSNDGMSQVKNSLSFGFNMTYFNDWKNRPLNFFNPELSYAKGISNSGSILVSINGFYGEPRSPIGTVPTDGLISNRLIFTSDIGYQHKTKNFSMVLGPTFRYRNERRILVYRPLGNLMDPKRAHFDFGLMGNLNYEVPINKKSSIDVRLAYRVFSNGVNPLSFGVFYSKRFL